jgi:hypothetical protein
MENIIIEEDQSRKRKRTEPVKFDARQIKNMAKWGLSNRIIADIVGCDEKTIRNRYGDIIKQGKAELQRKLIKSAVSKALEGDNVMIIWVTKNLCDWSDTPTGSTNQSLTVVKTTVNTNSNGLVEVKSETKEIEPT